MPDYTDEADGAQVASSATFHGGQHRSVSISDGYVFSRARAFVFADQPGTLTIEQSKDGATWRQTTSVDVLASAGTILESLIGREYVRASFTNTGGSTTTVFELETLLLEV